MTDNLFIQMCSCPEIQDGWEPKVGDFFLQEGEHLSLVLSCESFISGLDNKTKLYSMYAYIIWVAGSSSIDVDTFDSHIWLPSETDLWGMLLHVNTAFQLTGYLDTSGCRIYELRNLSIRDDQLIASASTAQEALIQGVMWELHSKQWSERKVGTKPHRQFTGGWKTTIST